ncbi:MAG: efflux RND transporter periplasmic adaptor subunit [Polyangiaceae bacterium]
MSKSRKSQVIRWLVALVVIAAVAVGAVLFWRARSKPPESIVVHPRELRQTIVSSGQVMPPAEVRLDSLLTSTVKAIAKREGDPVHAGDVLLTLDESDVDAAQTQAEAAIAQARAGKTSLKATTLPQANETLAQARANLSQARSELERQRGLFEAGVTTKSELDKAENAVQIYTSQEKAAELQVQAASAGGSSAVTAAAAISFAEAQLAAIKVTRERSRVVAPMDGVISSRFVEVGEVVRPGTALFVLTASGRTRVVLEPDERNLALLAIGQSALISAEAYPNESFEAKLSWIAPAVNGDRGTIEVRLDVPKPPAYLRPNMTVAVEVSIATREQALAVPLNVVQEPNGPSPWLGVLDERGRVTRRDIRIGLRGDDLVEILEGVADGDRVVLKPGSVAGSPAK